MDSFEFNKMAGALLGTLVICMGIGIVSEALFYHAPAKAGFDLPVPKKVAGPAVAPPPAPSLPALLAKASPNKGENDAHVCQACHNFEKGAGVKIGPPLYGVVGRKVASVSGFGYSDALKKVGGVWTLAKLFDWIKDPAAFAPGTKMTFGGESDPQKRADIVDYLRTLSDHPEPLPPVPAAAKAPAKGAPAPAKAAAVPGQPGATAAGGSPDAQLDAALAKGSEAKGKQEAQICEMCHNVAKGEGVKIGPPLYGVVDRPIASIPGFDYSDALKAKKGQKWTYANLSKWLENPQTFASGTKMAFPGEPNLQKRADLILWLRTLADKPAPLPKAAGAQSLKTPAPQGGSSTSGGSEPTPKQTAPITNGSAGKSVRSPAAPSASPSESVK